MGAPAPLDLVNSIVTYLEYEEASGTPFRALHEQLVMLEFFLGTLAASGLAWPYQPEDLNPRRLSSARRALEELIDDGAMAYTADVLESAVHGVAAWLVEYGFLEDNPMEQPWADQIGLWLSELPPPQSQPDMLLWQKADAVIYAVSYKQRSR